MEEIDASEANPFWKRLLEPETAYGINLNQPIAPILEKALGTGNFGQTDSQNAAAMQYEEESKASGVRGVAADEIKRMREMDKIRQNELALAQLTKK